MIPTELLYVPIFILFQNLFRFFCSEFTLELYFDQITFGSGPALLFAAVTDPQEAFRHPHH